MVVRPTTPLTRPLCTPRPVRSKQTPFCAGRDINTQLDLLLRRVSSLMPCMGQAAGPRIYCYNVVHGIGQLHGQNEFIIRYPNELEKRLKKKYTRFTLSPVGSALVPIVCEPTSISLSIVFLSKPKVPRNIILNSTRNHGTSRRDCIPGCILGYILLDDL